MNKEIWKDIPNYEGLYQISNLGRIKSVEKLDKLNHKRKEKILKCINNGRYMQVVLYRNSKKNIFLIHRLVALTFISNPNNYCFINHKNENPYDNNVNNLEWCTHKYNDNYGNRGNKISKSNSVKIKQYDLNNNYIKTWSSIKEANQILKINKALICMNLKKYKGRKTAGGYHFEYE